MTPEQLRHFAASLKCPAGWRVCDASERMGLTARLKQEVLPGHILDGRRCVAVIRSTVNDDVMYWCEPPGPVLALVHLTWGPAPPKPISRVPCTTQFEGVGDWNAFEYVP